MTRRAVLLLLVVAGCRTSRRRRSRRTAGRRAGAVAPAAGTSPRAARPRAQADRRGDSPSGSSTPARPPRCRRRPGRGCSSSRSSRLTPARASTRSSPSCATGGSPAWRCAIAPPPPTATGRAWRRCPALVRLDLSGSRHRRRRAGRVAQLPALTELYLADSDLDDRTVAIVAATLAPDRARPLRQPRHRRGGAVAGAPRRAAGAVAGAHARSATRSSRRSGSCRTWRCSTCRRRAIDD